MSIQTKSFFILIAVVAILGGSAYSLIRSNPKFSLQGKESSSKASGLETSLQPSAGYARYTDSKFPVSFNYPDTWQVQTSQQSPRLYTIGFNPSTIKIYISSDDCYGFTGLEYKTETLAGKTAKNVQDMLYCLPNADQFYTFDQGNDQTSTPAFQTLIHSISFN